jgi:hypothetical protein
MTIWHMRIACWVTKATDTHSQYVILIAFLLQQWLHERASVLRYMHITLSCYIIVPCMYGSSNKQYVSSGFLVKILFIVRATCPTHSSSWILLAY